MPSRPGHPQPVPPPDPADAEPDDTLTVPPGPAAVEMFNAANGHLREVATQTAGTMPIADALAMAQAEALLAIAGALLALTERRPTRG